MVEAWDGEVDADSCANVQRLRREGRAEDAIVAAEGWLHRTVLACGSKSQNTQTVAVDLVLAYNQVAMQMLSRSDIKVGSKSSPYLCTQLYCTTARTGTVSLDDSIGRSC